MGYKIAVIIVIFQLIAGLVVNILLQQNEKQYSISVVVWVPSFFFFKCVCHSFERHLALARWSGLEC